MSRPSDEKPGVRLEERARRAIGQYEMLREGDGIVVGVSGGADSVALLHFLRADGPPGRIVAAHLNHNLRGAESDRDAAFVRELCGRLGVPLVEESLPIAELAGERGRTVEECAREERYRLFRRVAAELAAQTGGPVKIATAHTLDDSAETVLLNLARGTGLRGLCGIAPVRRGGDGGAGLIRPLIGCARADVEEYCARHGLKYMTDSTNLTDDYTRNRLRHHVMPVLREVNPALLRAVERTTDALRADADYLDGLAAEALAPLRRGEHTADAEGLLELPEPLRRRALLLLLAEHGVAAERRRVERVEDLLRAGGAAQLSGAWFCLRDGGKLRFAPAMQDRMREERFLPIELHTPFSEGVHRVFSDKTLRVRVLSHENFEKSINNTKNQFKNQLDYDRIGKIVIIRLRMPGDRYRPAGRGCTKTLKKLFNEAGFSPEARRRTLVLEGENGLLWVEGFGAAEEVCVGPDTRRFLRLEVCGSTDHEME